MTSLEERRQSLTQQFQQAQTEAANWSQRMQQLQGAILLIDELLKEQQPSALSPNGGVDER